MTFPSFRMGWTFQTNLSIDDQTWTSVLGPNSGRTNQSLKLSTDSLVNVTISSSIKFVASDFEVERSKSISSQNFIVFVIGFISFMGMFHNLKVMFALGMITPRTFSGIYPLSYREHKEPNVWKLYWSLDIKRVYSRRVVDKTTLW